MSNTAPIRLSSEQEAVVSDIANWHANRSRIDKSYYLAGYAGSGKAQPLHSIVYTPDGPVTMGQIHENDVVCTPDGGTARVTGVFGQGKRPIYRFVFDDGTAVESCDQHLWKVEDRTKKSDLKKYKTATRIYTTSYIVEKLGKIDGDRRFYIPTPVCEFLARPVPVDPYLMGLLLGDGSIGADNFGITTADEEILSWCESAVKLWNCKIKPVAGDPYRYNIVGVTGRNRWNSSSVPLRDSLRGLGVWNRAAREKFIPSIYLHNSREVRLAILQGLMDTDGTVSRTTGMASFCSVSRLLAEGVSDLVRSLGGKASITPKVKTCDYKGETKECQAYEVNVGYNDTPEFFRLSRKRSLAKRRTKYFTQKCIRSAEYIGEIECQCIMVDHPAHLYVTDGYTPTHNTTVTRAIIAELGLNGKTLRACALTAKASKVLARKLGVEATTLHSLNYRYVPDKDLERLQDQLRGYRSSLDRGSAENARNAIDGMLANGRFGKFAKRDASELAGVKLIIADECFDYDQKILTENGWERIGVIVNRKSPIRVWSRNPVTGELELKPIVRWLKNPLRGDMLKIDAGRSESNRGARVIRCTDTHKILTPKGYVPAGDLREGDMVVIRGVSLTQEQLDVVVGSLFGDGSLCSGKARSSPQFKITHGEKQLPYLQSKRSVFGDLTGAGGIGRSGFTGEPIHYLTVDMVDQMYDLKKMMLAGGRGKGGWSPDDKLVDMLTPHAVAVWYLDNGSVDSRELQNGDVSLFARIATNRFSESDCHRLAKHLLERYGVEAAVHADGERGWVLWFGKDATSRLFDLVEAYVPACMGHKLPGRTCRWVASGSPASETCEARIRSIAPYSQRRSHVYDIEVADHHNYVAGNIVVSNCSMLTDRHTKDLARFDIPILYIGDPGQLDPILSGEDAQSTPFSQLFAHDSFLTQIHRQAEGSPIYEAAFMARTGKVIPYRKMKDGFAKFTMDKLRDNPQILTWADVILCQRHVTRRVLTTEIRKQRGIDSPQPLAGETVVCRLNNHELGIARGEQYTLLEDAEPFGEHYRLALMGEDEERVDVVADRRLFDALRDPELAEDVDAGRIRWNKRKPPFDFGYVLTVHSAQGSEWDKVLVVDDYSARRWKPDEYKRWNYTAITRAMKELAIAQ